jgi:hypothetical protein
LQTVFLQNDREVLDLIDRRGGWLQDVAKDLGVPFSAAGGGEPQRSRADADRAQRILANAASLEKRAAALRTDGKKKEAEKLLAQVAELRKQVRRTDPPPTETKAARPQKADRDDVARVVDEAYLRTLSRFPTDAERQRSAEFVASADDTLGGVRGLLWALLNTKEFIVNH